MQKKGEEYPPEKRVNFSTDIIYSHKNMGMKMDLVFTIYDYWYRSDVNYGLPFCVA
jgi:hypothetical protein